MLVRMKTYPWLLGTEYFVNPGTLRLNFRYSQVSHVLPFHPHGGYTEEDWIDRKTYLVMLLVQNVRVILVCEMSVTENVLAYFI